MQSTEPNSPAGSVLEALAREIDPSAWTEVHPHPTAFANDLAAREQYEAYFEEGQRDRRAPSLAIADRLLTSTIFEVRPHGTNPHNEAPQTLLNEFYTSGLRRAIQIIQGEDYPLSNGLARVSSMVSDIEDEIAMQEDVQLSEADVVVRWLTTFAERGIVTIGGKGGALDAAREARPEKAG